MEGRPVNLCILILFALMPSHAVKCRMHLRVQIKMRVLAVGLSFIRRTEVVFFPLLPRFLSCALLKVYFRICTLYLLEYDSTS